MKELDLKNKHNITNLKSYSKLNALREYLQDRNCISDIELFYYWEFKVFPQK